MFGHASLRIPTCFVLVAGLFVGCATESADTESKGSKPRVALIMKSLANEFFSTMADGAKAHHQQHADQYDLIVNGIKDERDLARQVGLVEEMIAMQVDAIVIAPADSKALAPVLKRARKAGVAVVNIDNKLDADVLAAENITIPFVGPDNRDGAKQVAAYLAKRLQRGDAVAVLEGVPTAYNAVQRKLGFEDAMNEAGMTIVDSQSGQWETGVANQIAAVMLAEHPEIKALLCSNDSMALGALAATKLTGRADDVAIIGFDNIAAVREAIRNGEIVATVDQHGDRLAEFGIEYALELITQDTSPADKQTPVDLVTAESLD